MGMISNRPGYIPRRASGSLHGHPTPSRGWGWNPPRRIRRSSSSTNVEEPSSNWRQWSREFAANSACPAWAI